jgi:hypothetical protein
VAGHLLSRRGHCSSYSHGTKCRGSLPRKWLKSGDVVPVWGYPTRRQALSVLQLGPHFALEF